jgi:hypothetical protein
MWFLTLVGCIALLLAGDKAHERYMERSNAHATFESVKQQIGMESGAVHPKKQ